MADFTVREGDSFTIADTLADAAGAAVDIEGASVQFVMIPLGGGAAKIDAAWTVDQVGDGSDGSKGKVSYTSAAGDTDTAGLYLGSWVVTYAGGSVQTFPNGGYILVEVTADAPVTVAARFADSTDLETRLGVVFTADEHIRANALLADASDEIRTETGQTVTLVTDDVIELAGTTDERILLPQRPVVSVASVEIDGVAISDWYQAGNEIVRGRTLTVIDGVLDSSYGGWLRSFGVESQTLRITYTHGYDTIPARVKNIALEMVVRVWSNPGSVIQETDGPVEVTYAPYAAPPRGLQLTDSERRALKRLFGSKAGNVWIGS